MKTFLLQTFALVTLLLFASGVKAQDNDYVITTQGDTLRCTISNSFFVKNGRYKTAQMKKPGEMTTDDIKEYYVSKDNILYRKVSTSYGRTGTAKFMEVLENGKINLYQETTKTTSVGPNISNGPYSSSPTEYQRILITWYIAKGTDTAKKIDPNFSILDISLKSRESRGKEFAQMIQDNTVVYNKYLADEKFSSTQVRDLIHLYNTGKTLGWQDYVVTRTNDTIFCEIEPASSNNVGRYRVNPKDRFIKIDTNITGYFLSKNSSTFLLKTLPGDKRPRYVKCLVTGKIDLYAYSLNNTVADDEASLYASKELGELVLIKNEFSRSEKKEKKALTGLISDNPNVNEKFTSLPYNFTSVLTCVKMYNSD